MNSSLSIGRLLQKPGKRIKWTVVWTAFWLWSYGILFSKKLFASHDNKNVVFTLVVAIRGLTLIYIVKLIMPYLLICHICNLPFTKVLFWYLNRKFIYKGVNYCHCITYYLQHSKRECCCHWKGRSSLCSAWGVICTRNSFLSKEEYGHSGWQRWGVFHTFEEASRGTFPEDSALKQLNFKPQVW